MPLRRRWAAAMVVLGVAAFSPAAQAQRVALVRPSDSDPVLVEAFNRLTAELRLQDFEVTIAETPGDARTPENLGIVARRADALASIAFVQHEGRTAVDVWLYDRATGRSLVRRLEPTAGTELPNVLAIRAVDLLRVSLREFGGEPQQEIVRIDRPVPADTATRVAPAPIFRPWEVRAEGLMIFDGPSVGAAFGAALGFARRFSESVRVGILVSGPLIGPSWETNEGSAFIRQEIGWAEARLSWWRMRRVDLGASLAAGVHYLTAQGANAKPPLASQNDQVWSLAGVIGADGSFRFTSNAGVAFTLRAIGLTPRAGVGVGDNATVLQWPLFSASVGFLVGF
jgi:hypothetical protein